MAPNHLQNKISIPSPSSPAYLFSFIFCWSFLALHRHINSMIVFSSCLEAFAHLFLLPKMFSSSHSANLAHFFSLQNLLIYCWQKPTYSLCLSSKCLPFTCSLSALFESSLLFSLYLLCLFQTVDS